MLRSFYSHHLAHPWNDSVHLFTLTNELITDFNNLLLRTLSCNNVFQHSWWQWKWRFVGFFAINTVQLPLAWKASIKAFMTACQSYVRWPLLGLMINLRLPSIIRTFYAAVICSTEQTKTSGCFWQLSRYIGSLPAANEKHRRLTSGLISLKLRYCTHK